MKILPMAFYDDDFYFGFPSFDDYYDDDESFLWIVCKIFFYIMVVVFWIGLIIFWYAIKTLFRLLVMFYRWANERYQAKKMDKLDSSRP